MYFTEEDYRKIEAWLKTRTAKDSDFLKAYPLTGKEDVPIIQEGQNRLVPMEDLIAKITMANFPDFFNVTNYIDKGNLTIEEAVNCVPAEKRKLGMAITFHNDKNNWVILQFCGVHINQWSSLCCWKNILDAALDDIILFRPDEEDTTEVVSEGKSLVKFKDRSTADEFVDKGRVILRKNIQGSPSCAIDDEDHLVNVLTQHMIKESGTIYEVRYHFDLQGKVIKIPTNSTLLFEGGTINNGTLVLSNTSVLGAYEYSGMGNITIQGTFVAGQVMTFAEGNRQVLKWYNGAEWKLLLDITDYNEIISRINDLIDKHNREVAEINRSIGITNERIDNLTITVSDLSKSVDDRFSTTNENITNLSRTLTVAKEELQRQITNVSNSLTNLTNNLDNTIKGVIGDYMTNVSLGAVKITINGKEYSIDENQNITVSNIIADSTKGTLTVKSGTGDTLGVFSGSEDVIITLPKVEIPETGEPVVPKENELLTIQDSNGKELVTYNGESPKTLKLPAPPVPADPGKITFRGISDSDIVYNGKDDLIVNIPKSSQDSGTVVPKTTYRFTVLWSGLINNPHAGTPSSNLYYGYGGDSRDGGTGVVNLRLVRNLNDGRITGTITSTNSDVDIRPISLVASIAQLRNEKTGTDRWDYAATTIAGQFTDQYNFKIYALHKTDKNQRSFDANGLTDVGADKSAQSFVTRFYLTIYGMVKDNRTGLIYPYV